MNEIRDKWAKSLAFNVAFAERILTTRGNLAPMFIIEADGKKFVVQAHFANLAEKEMVTQFVQLWAVAFDADAVTSLAEAWMSSPPVEGKTKDELVSTAVQPSKDPNRQEAVVALAVYRDGGQRRVQQAIHLIERNTKGRVTGLGLNLAAHDVEFAGRFVELLSPERPGPELRASAKAAFDSMPMSVRQAFTPKPIKPTKH